MNYFTSKNKQKDKRIKDSPVTPLNISEKGR